MKEFNYTITDPEGIHMRPAGELVKAAKQFESRITISKDGKTGDCKKVFTIMSLAVKNGQEVTISVEGADEEEAAQNSLKKICDDGISVNIFDTDLRKGGFYERI